MKVLGFTLNFCFSGFFKALNQEFILTNTSISITIMPLPYVLTEKVCTLELKLIITQLYAKC